jgi:hypothetical protein
MGVLHVARMIVDIGTMCHKGSTVQIDAKAIRDGFTLG